MPCTPQPCLAGSVGGGPSRRGSGRRSPGPGSSIAGWTASPAGRSSRGSAPIRPRPGRFRRRRSTCSTRRRNRGAAGTSRGCPPVGCPTFGLSSSVSDASWAPIPPGAGRSREQRRSGFERLNRAIQARGATRERWRVWRHPYRRGPLKDPQPGTALPEGARMDPSNLPHRTLKPRNGIQPRLPYSSLRIESTSASNG